MKKKNRVKKKLVFFSTLKKGKHSRLLKQQEEEKEQVQQPAPDEAEPQGESAIAPETDGLTPEMNGSMPEEDMASPEETVSAQARRSAAYHIARKKANWQKAFRTIIPIVLILALCAAVVVSLRIYIEVGINTLEVSFYHLQSDEVDEPFRIVQLSDLHMHEFGEKNAELVDWVRRLHPDIIAITGDMNNDFDPDYHVVIDLCEQLVEIADVYYVMGNHEWVDYIDRHSAIKDDITATGVTVLQNAFVEREINGNKVLIGGLVNEVFNYYNYSGPKFMEDFMASDGFKLLLVHYPEYFLGTLNDYAVDLAMCGHVHGGIVRILHFGGVYATDQGFLPELSEGIQRVEGGSTVVVSRGLGGEGAIPRINNNPELVVVDVSWY
ncbi:MAG: metallophosphoesterase [bacterium]